MHYLGGKYALRNEIYGIINANIGRRAYWEPFAGAINIVSNVRAVRGYASDAHKELIAMWRAFQNGWLPPDEVSEELYARCKSGLCSPELTAFIGFGCSFAGKYYGGYARDNCGGDYVKRATMGALYKISTCADVKFFNADFLTYEPPEEHMLIYCDPPYINTTGYKGVGGI